MESLILLFISPGFKCTIH